ncbi:hypothetical protein [Novosphingobium sp. ST904]|uniref:hypothetical protein n=1 Tax=Novosphingobium sp. ST904 TaxID=1684385 RepID=UPI0006C8B761|nr:hypothetical protein [Novosphingobium sp. ST904]KPH60353.1 hypothetical protein ADT71_19760 [Novosphingobium sp. ST904]TCM40104.1 hypothetical protein EDF59_105344 [Novosphingobium sp. ST904]
MTSRTSAGTTLAISAGRPATFDAAGFGALTKTLIGEITNVDGDLGRVYNLVTHNPLATRATVKKKGSYNSGSLNLTLAIDEDDAGQIIAEAALKSDADYTFELTLQDGAKRYFMALVMSFPTTVGTVDDITTGTINLEITANDDGDDFVKVAAP